MTMTSCSQRPDIFAFEDYRSFLAAHFAFRKSSEGLSFRQLGQELGFKSPNYLQKIVNGERHVSPTRATALAKALGLNGNEIRFFELLVARVYRSTESELELDRLRKRAATGMCPDQSIFSSWLHGVIWELATAKHADTSFQGLCSSLAGNAKPADIKESLDFLLSRGYLVETAPHTYIQKNVIFKYADDQQRSIDIQRSHATFLKMALHRLNDDLGEREFQGLTIAVSSKKITVVKERLRAFVANLAAELSDDPEADRVLRVQCGAFRVTR